MATGRCDFTYLLFQAFALRLLNLRGDFDRYDDYMAQTKNLFQDLVDIRIKFEPKAEQIAKQFAEEPYTIFIASGALWGENVLFSMRVLEEMQWTPHPCRHVRRVLPRHPRARRARRARDHHQGEDECRELDNRAEVFCKQYTDKLAVIDTAEYAVSGLDDEFRPLVSPMIAAATLHERLSKHYERITKHNLAYRRYYRQFAY